MEYLTAKESRVERAWNKRGLAGLRSELLQKITERDFHNWIDEQFVLYVSNLVFNMLPEREWNKAEQYIEETAGVVGVAPDENFYRIISKMRMSQEMLREEVGDE